MTTNTKVTRVATWAGWCTPCQSDDRPLVLTRTGPGGLRAWFGGLGDEHRLLVLTCAVCGVWQVVPAHEEDPQVAPAASAEVLAAAVPAPRAEPAAVEQHTVVDLTDRAAGSGADVAAAAAALSALAASPSYAGPRQAALHAG